MALPPSFEPKPDPLNVLGLAAGLHRAGLESTGRALYELSAAVTRPDLRTVVVGRFSSGKSTLINAFLGYPVLPGGLPPTTGVLCRISYGQPGAHVYFANGREETFSGPESVGPYLSLQPQKTGSGQAVTRVEVTLPLALLEPGMEIVDSPGLDEDVARTDIAASSLASADIVLFVLAADQLMGEVERRFLSEHIIPRTPLRVALVVNFWDRLPESERHRSLERLELAARELRVPLDPDTGRPPLFTLSALQAVRRRWRESAAQKPDEIGIENLESWLGKLARQPELARQQAWRGQVLYAIGQGVRQLDRERPTATATLQDATAAIAEADSAMSQLADVSARAIEISKDAERVLLESLAIRSSSADAEMRAMVEARLKRDPYDSLPSLRPRLEDWWRGLRKAVEEDAASIVTRVAGALSEGGLTIPDGAVPPLTIRAPAPAPHYHAAQDISQPVKDTIAGLIGSVSLNAADRAARALDRTSRAVARMDPIARRVTEAAFDSIDHAVTISAYQARCQVREWAADLLAQVNRVVAAAGKQIEERRSSSHARLEEASTRVRVLDDLAASLADVAR